MATFKETSKEREKVLRAKLKEANENGRLADLEVGWLSCAPREIHAKADLQTELAPKTKATRQPSVDVDAAPKAKPRAVSPISPKKRELPKPKEKVRKVGRRFCVHRCGLPCSDTLGNSGFRERSVRCRKPA